MKKKFTKKEKLKALFKRFSLENISLTPSASSISIKYENFDREAAWLLYVELLTRIITQPLKENEGDESAALESIHKLFQITRDILKQYGRKAILFTKISIIVLNQEIRPFTAKWHKIEKAKLLENNLIYKKQFRNELNELRSKMENYSRLLAEMANVEDLTKFYNK